MRKGLLWIDDQLEGLGEEFPDDGTGKEEKPSYSLFQHLKYTYWRTDFPLDWTLPPLFLKIEAQLAGNLSFFPRIISTLNPIISRPVVEVFTN